jgi:hypothetical protein
MAIAAGIIIAAVLAYPAHAWLRRPGPRSAIAPPITQMSVRMGQAWDDDYAASTLDRSRRLVAPAADSGLEMRYPWP